MEDILILVDNNDNPVGSGTELSVHQQGLLHRAFSIFIFDSKGRLMLQQRALSKYHSAGLWTNSCCGHPILGEETGAAARRQLQEEMGFYSELQEVSSLTYHAAVPGNLIEHEFDHIYVGLFDGKPQMNPEEVDDWFWIDIHQLIREIEQNPDIFTVWFRIILDNTHEIARWGQLVSR